MPEPSPTSPAPLDHERATNEHYIRTVEQKQTARRQLSAGIASTPSAKWTDTSSTIGRHLRRIYALIGRVGLITDDEDLGTSYYIGDTYVPASEMNAESCVISWTAPAAKIFFQGQDTQNPVPDPRSLAARRTFRAHNDQLVNYEDELEAGVNPVSAFRMKPAEMIIPAPPSSSPDPSRTLPVISERGPQEQQAKAPDPGPKMHRPSSDRPKQLRAEGLVLKSLDTPRTGRLPSVLNTLQPDQYRCVTWPADTPLLLQGNPGTGKTVIATYRALYLTHVERPEQRLRRVALVGPTEAWKHHVASLISDAGADGVDVINLEGMIRDTAKGSWHALHHKSQRWFKVDRSIYRIALGACKKLNQQGRLHLKKTEATKQLIEVLCTRTPIHRDLARGQELSQWLLGIKSYSEARKRPDCLLLFAAISVALERHNRRDRNPFPLDSYDHIIVDEAQDIRGVEWAILHEMCRDSGTWSIIGDINQRRADYTFGSWKDLISKLKVGDPEDDNAVQILNIGYRSTQQINRFAKSLIAGLPEEWRSTMLRNGPEPIVEKVASKQLKSKVLHHIDRLTKSYPEGTTAVIGTDLADIARSATRAGWRRREQDPMLHNNQGHKLMLADHIQARGLEFDGVVIVEPVDFPKNLGRDGPLYTSLTRANQELVVIHTKKLPDKLRRRSRHRT